MRVPFLTAAAVLALAACEAPRGAVPPMSPEAARAPEPELLETARFGGALAEAGPRTERLTAEQGSLAARAEALRDRAAALDDPVMDDEERARLARGVASPPAIPDAQELSDPLPPANGAP